MLWILNCDIYTCSQKKRLEFQGFLFFQQFCKRKKYPVWAGLLLFCLFVHFKTYKVDLEFKQKELISSHGICVLTAAAHVALQASWHCSSQLGKTADCFYPLAAEWQLLALLGSPVRMKFPSEFQLDFFMMCDSAMWYLQQ